MQPNPLIPQTLQRIVLVGFMGAGKSTVGPVLADRLGWSFVDTDHSLQTLTGKTIAELFRTHGEAVFRQMESKIISELMGRQHLVIALGGGAIEIESTRSLLTASTHTCEIFLKASLEVSIERCEKQPTAAIRPILQHRETLTQRFQSRLPYYARAHFSVDTEGLHPNQVVDSILHLMDDSLYVKSLI